jgi:hypothetical protein
MKRAEARHATPFRFAAPVRVEAGAADNPRRLFIVGYTGGPMRVEGMGRIVVDLSGLELPNSIPVLADHDATLKGVVGAGNPTTDGRQLLVSATLADTPAAATVLSIIESGVELQASLGAEPLEHEPVEEEETVQVNGQTLTGPFSLITRAKLKEMTVLPLGADDKTSVSLAAKAARSNAMKFKAMLKAAKAAGDAKAMKFGDDEIDKMTETEAKAALKKCMAQVADDDDDDDEDSDIGEKPASARAVDAIFRGTSPELQARAARERWSVSRCKAEALHHLRASRAPDAINTARGTGAYSGDSETLVLAALVMRTAGDAAAVKAYGERTAQAVRDAGLQRMPFSELFACHLQAHGVDPGPRRDLEGMIRAAAVSNASMPNLLSNALNKLLEQQWVQAPGTWRSWCAIRAAQDFKPAKSLRPVFNGTLDVLPATGEIANGSLTDWMVEWKLTSFAKMFTIGRQMLINDDLSGLSELPMGLALMADRAVSDLVYYNLLANPGSFFGSGNGNNQSGGPSALSAASLTTAIKQLRLQKGPNNAPLNIPPATLMVSPDLEQTAKELLHSSFQFRDQTADRQPAGNPLAQAVNLVVEPRLTLGAKDPISGVTAAGVAAQWFLFSAPEYLPGIVGFLNGQQTPIVQASDPLGFNFDVPGQSWRCIYDFGFSLGDYRACQRSVGS